MTQIFFICISNKSTLLLLHTLCVGVKLSIGFKSFINENWNLKKKKKFWEKYDFHNIL